MSANKIYYVTESQFKLLIEKKKSEKVILKNILQEIELKRSTLNESTGLNEGIIDTVKSYVSKGLMTTALIASLLSSNQVNAQQLQAAGVPKEKIEQAIGGGNSQTSTGIPLDKIEARLLQTMKRNNLSGTIASYQKLNPQQKEKILKGIQGKIKSIDDVDKFQKINVGGWQNAKNDNAIEFDQQHQVKIQVDTSATLMSLPMSKFFKFNSPALDSAEAAKEHIKKYLDYFTVVDSIVINTSSSTLRNTGEAEGLTWKQLSDKRAESLINVLNGLEHDLGGQNVNPKQVINAQMIKTNTNGTNGDGSSGPKSPYEVDQNVVAAYQKNNIDPIFWKSAAKEAPLSNKAEYEKYQTANIVIYGRIVTTETEDVPSYRYIFMNVQKGGGKMDVKNDHKKADVSKCPVKFKTQEVNKKLN